MALRVGVLLNPAAGGTRGARRQAGIPALLRGYGHDVVDLSASDAEQALANAASAVRSGGLDAIVAAGGDGSVNVAVNACAGTSTPLLIVPGGTGNDIAAELGLAGRSVESVLALLQDGRRRSIDLARWTDALGTQRWFAGVLAAGFDAVVNERANGWRWPRGRARYTVAMARELPGFRAISYHFTVDGQDRDASAMLVSVANTASYGGGMRVCPDARPDDGLLDVLVVHRLPMRQFLRVFPKVFTGQHVGHPKVEVLRGRSVTVAASGIVAYADGERFGPLPCTIEAVPHALTVIVPAAPDEPSCGPGVNLP